MSNASIIHLRQPSVRRVLAFSFNVQR